MGEVMTVAKGNSAFSMTPKYLFADDFINIIGIQ